MRGINAARELVARLDASLAATPAGTASHPHAPTKTTTTEAGRRGVSKARTRPTSWARFIVLTGLSGSGKSQAIRALEDLGYYCVDNLPVSLLPVMAELSRAPDRAQPRRRGDGHPRAALRQRLPARLSQAEDQPSTCAATLIFLEAGHAELVRRFSETRRPHPLAPDRPVTEGPVGRARLAARRSARMADKVIDTSKLNVHELRQQLRELVSGRKQASKLVLTFLSFGFQNGPPAEADLMFDVRFLKNPHWVPALRPQTGKDPAVAAYIRRQPTRAHGDQEAVVAAAMDGAALRRRKARAT